MAIGYKASTFKTPKNSPSTNFEHGDPGDHAQSVAIGYEATASGDQSVALGAQARAEGNSSIAIGGDDLDKVASKSPPEWNTTGNNDTSNNTDVAMKYKEITKDYLVDFGNKEKRYTATKAGKAAVAIGVQSQAGDLATAFGTRTIASGTTSVALGVGASATEEGSFAAAAGAKSEGKSSIAIGTASKATKEGAVAVGKDAQSTDESSIAIGTAANAMHSNSVALGSGSETAPATPQTQGMVNGVTYGNFAGVGSAKNGSVSVGKKDAERQIKHVAAGEISATSTDAINGSQLYMVAKGTLEQMPVVYTNKNGVKVFKQPDGKFTDAEGNTHAPADIIASMQNADGSTTAPMVLRNVASNLPATYNNDAYNKNKDSVTKSKALPDNVNVNNAATVGDVLNAGWNLQGNGVAKDFVKAYDTVNFVNGTGTTAKVTSNAKGTSSDVTFDVNTDGTTITTNSSGQITANTTGLTNGTDGKVNTPSDADKGKLVNAGDIANAINNAGFNVQTNGGNKELVKTGETVNFVNGDNIQITNDGKKITVATAKDVTFNSVTTGNTTLKNNGLTIAGGPSVTNTGINAGNKRITNVTAGTKDTDAVNLKQLKDSRTTVQSSDNSISVTQTKKGGRFDYDIKVNNQVIVENAQLPVVYTNQDGDKLTKAPNGKFYKPEEIAKATLVGDKYYAPDQLEGGKPKPGATAINPTANNNVIASMQNADGSTTAPTTLTNVKSNLPSTYNNDVYNTGNKPVTTGQTLPEKINTSNAATAGDVLNSGWNLQGNGVAKDFVKAYDTANFVNGTGTTAKVTTNKEGTSSNVTFDVNTDGTTITTKKVADPNNPGKTITQVTANTTKLGDANKDGKVDTPSDDNKGKLVTAGDIANAINNAGFTLTVQGKNGSLVKPGATVNMKNTDKNIVIDKSANSNDVVYNLAKDITVDSVKAGNTTLNNNGVTINNGPSFTKDKVDVAGNKITGVADGDISATSKDAINGSQLHAVARKVDNLNARIDGVADDANAGVSSAMAMAALPQAYLPGKSMLTGGMASYNGEGAVAVGFSKLSDNGRWVLKMSGSADTQGNAGVAVGAGFHF
ncbi:YadA-like family protein [Moraxella lacunata]|uniref:YadA-like family protein n=1 Tax=Moraxella lacunata TaxID=477 RepID=UPI0024ADCCF8|nr:YadA-like family protein [Moraxella lacunata]MDI4508311.1 hypothetical protein [Moraxella lacunata]